MNETHESQLCLQIDKEGYSGARLKLWDPRQLPLNLIEIVPMTKENEHPENGTN